MYLKQPAIGFLKKISTFILLAVPVVAYGQTFRTISESISSFLLDMVVPLLLSLALLFFFWGLAQYIFQAGDQSAVEVGKQRMIWGIVGLFSISAVWGLVKLLGGTFSIL